MEDIIGNKKPTGKVRKGIEITFATLIGKGCFGKGCFGKGG